MTWIFSTTVLSISENITAVCYAHCQVSLLSFTSPRWNLLCLQSFLNRTEWLHSFVLQVVAQEV